MRRVMSTERVSTTNQNKQKKNKDQRQQQTINCKTQPNRESNTFLPPTHFKL